MSYIDKTMGRGESPITITRRHIVVLVGYAFKWFGLFLVCFILALWLTVNWQVNVNDPASTFKTVLVLALFALALVSIVAMIANYIRWYNEVYIITNRRVIRMQGIFNKDETDSSLDKLNDTKEHQSLWGRIFGYGTVEIMTASEAGLDELDYVPNPLQFRKQIQDAKNGYYNQQPNPPVLDQAANPNFNAPASTGMYDQVSPDNYRQGQAGPPSRSQGGNGYQPRPNPQLDAIGSSGQIKPHDVPGLIQQLAGLRDAGVITEAEFQAKKNDLMSRM